MLLALLLTSAYSIQGQNINLIRFNSTATYTSGSRVSVIINPTDAFSLDNQFTLELSDENGAWSSARTLNTVNEFYIPAINGTLPAGLAASNKYKLRICSTDPVAVVETEPFTITTATSIPVPSATSSFPSNSTYFSCQDIFGSLTASYGATVGTSIGSAFRDISINNYNSSYTYNIKLTNVLSGTTKSITQSNGTFTIPDTLKIGTYVFEIEQTNGTISSSCSIIFLFHGNGTSLNNSSSETVCVNDDVVFNVSTDLSGIGRNYYGSKYTVDFGDGSPILMFTHAELMKTSGIPHKFQTVSCDKGESKFFIYEKLLNKGISSSGDNNYCSTYHENGNSATRNVNASKAPVADFALMEKQCISEPIIAINATTLGSFGSSGGCISTPVYFWYYKKPGETNFTKITDQSWIDPATYNLKIPVSFVNNLAGCWEIKLAASNTDLCQTVSEKIHTIQIETTPVPSFTISPVSPICALTAVQFTNTTNLTSLTCQSPNYNWIIAPDLGIPNNPATANGFQFTNSTTNTSVDPKVLFTQPGTYSITLTTQNMCGTSTSTATKIVVNGDPSVSLNSTSLTMCADNPANYTLDINTATTKPIYSTAPFAPSSYEWTISGSGVTAADYSFSGGTSAASPYPKITFNAFKTYTLKIKVNGDCGGSNEKTFTFTLNEIPTLTIPDSGLAQTICSGESTTELPLTASINGTTFNWIATPSNGTTVSPSSGNGNSIPATIINNTTNINGTVSYSIIPRYNGCTGAIKNLTVTVKPKAHVNTLSQAFVCNNISYTPQVFTSDVAGATFSWSNDNTAIGLAASGTGDLPAFTTSNTGINPISANITVTPTANGCIGTAFVHKITVNPTPTVNNIGMQLKCSGELSDPISFSGDVPGTVYNWTNNNSNIGLASSGTGDIPAFTFNNPTNSVQTATITVTPSFTNGGATCTGTPKSFNITVNPQAQVIQPENIAVCNGTSSSAITLATNNISGTTTYAWTNDNTSIGLASSGTGDIPAFAAVNPGTTPIVATIKITPTLTNGNTCSGTTKSFTITVNPTPTVNNITNIEQCAGVINEPIVFTSPVSGTTYSWTNSDPAIGLSASGSGNIPTFLLTNSTAGTITATIKVTPSANGCTGPDQSFTITVNRTVGLTLTGPDGLPASGQVICSGDNTSPVTLTSATTGVILKWAVTPSPGVTAPQQLGTTDGSTTTTSIPTQALINTTSSPVNVVYETTATLTDATHCEGPKSIYTITVNPRPAVSGSIAKTICNGSLFNATPTDGSGNIIPANTTYTWTNPIINPPSAISGGTSGTDQSTISQTLTNSTNQTATATYTVTPTAYGCTGSPFDVVVTVNPTPTVNNVSNCTYCEGETSDQVNFTGDVTGTTFNWTCDKNIGIEPSGSGNILPFTTTNNTTSPIIANITMTPNFNGCNGTSKQFTITVNPKPVITTPLDNIEMCNNTSRTAIGLSGNVSGTTFDWTCTNNASIGLGSSGSGDIPTLTASNNGTTPIIATITTTPKANGCVGTPKTFTVTVNPTPTVDVVTSQELCNGFQTNAINFTGNIPTTTYNWVNSNPTIGLAGSGIGDIPAFTATNNGNSQIAANITVTPILNGCDGLPTIFSIKVNPTPAFTIQPESKSVCLNDHPTLSVDCKNATGTPTYKWFSRTDNTSSFSEIITATSATYTPLTDVVGKTDYYCEITFPTGGCSNLTSDTATITVNPYPVISQYTTRIGSGQTFNVTPTTANGDIVPAGTAYTWTIDEINPSGSIEGASAQSNKQTTISQLLTNKTAGIATITYLVTPHSGDCVGDKFKIVVTVNPVIIPHSIKKNISCFGIHNGSIQTAIEGGIPFSTGDPYIVSWTGPSFTSHDTSINNLFPGIYTLTITDNGGIPFTDSYTISEPSEISLTKNIDKSISCFGAADGKIDISVSGGTPPYQYTWTKDGVAFTPTNNESLSGLEHGEYLVSVTDQNGCGPKTSAFVINEPTLLQIIQTGQTNLLCYGDSVGTISVDIKGGTPIEKSPGVFDYNYSWSGPNGYTNTNKNLTNLVAGLYTLTTTDNNGCTQNLVVNITQPDEVSVKTTVTPVTCFGANDATIKLDISGGVPPYQIQWSNFGKGTFLDNLSPGDYTITVVDANACQKTVNINIPEAQFYIEPTTKNVSCFGAHNGSISLNVHGGVAPINLVWLDNATAGSTRNNLAPGTYTAILSDASSCSFTEKFTIIEPLELKLSADIKNAFDCNNPNSGSISLVVSGGSQPYSYTWSNGATTKDLSNIPAGTYVANITDANGCTLNEKFEVIRQLPISLSVDIVPDYNCDTKVIKEICTAQATGGIPPYQYTWSSGTTSGTNNKIMETTQRGIITLGVTDGLGCTKDYTFDLLIPYPGIEFQLTNCNDRTYSFNALVPIGAASDYTYFWDFGDGKTETKQNPEHKFSDAGTYKVVLTLKNSSCTNVYEKYVTVEPAPNLVLDKLPIFCTGDSILLHVSGADSYRWSDNSSGDNMSIKQPGDYFVIGTSKAGCTSTLNFKATNFDSYNYTIQSDKDEITTDNPSVQLWSESITYSDYFWDFGDGKSAQGNNIDHYFDNLRDGYYEVKLKVKNPNGCNEYATKKIWTTNTSTNNVFTPNGDGIDDVFMQGWHIKVYNRNGILMYDGTTGWDGTFKGKPVSNDTYFYIVYISSVSGIKSNTGFITVIR